MTRFARAKGSKASNERAPEDGTPWEVMKEQLLRAKQENDDAKKREEAEKQRIDNYEKFLNEQKISKRKATWCDFPEAENSTKNNGASLAKKKKKNKDKPSNGIKQIDSTENSNVSDEVVTTDNIKNKKKKNKQKNKNNEISLNVDGSNANVDVNGENHTPKKKHIQADPSEQSEKQVLPASKNTKKKNKKQKQNNQSTENNESPAYNAGDSTKNVPIAKNNMEKQNKQNKQNKKIKLQANGEPIRRKAIDDHSFQLIINGKEVELIRFEGFPIMKKDAERLQELKSSMIKKGIPKSEVQRTIKLERRRAEKALARLRREVCYNCRKGGHNLSDCPELKSKIPGVDGANDGLCFKCGSTEHRQFECKVQRDKEFRFATCFICKDQGHIARQCPDNPKGLYPNGGCCKLCGDVTHLKKDCPTTKDQKEETSVKLQTLNDGDLEDIGLKQNSAVPEESSKKPKKIKF